MIPGSWCHCAGPMRRWPTAGSSMEKHYHPNAGSSGLAKGTGTETGMVMVIERSGVSMQRCAGIVAMTEVTSGAVLLERTDGGQFVGSVALIRAVPRAVGLGDGYDWRIVADFSEMLVETAIP